MDDTGYKSGNEYNLTSRRCFVVQNKVKRRIMWSAAKKKIQASTALLLAFLLSIICFFNMEAVESSKEAVHIGKSALLKQKWDSLQ